MNSQRLELFYSDYCPYCQVVLKEIERLNLLVAYKNIQENNNHLERLLNDTGRRTVPCLYIDQRPLFESLDIIEWLDKNLDTLEKRQSAT